VKAKFKQSSIKTEQIIRLGFLVVLYWAVYLYFCIYRYPSVSRFNHVNFNCPDM
jgi:hypothetical protein